MINIRKKLHNYWEFHSSIILNMKNGNRTIPINHLITLAKYYNTSIDYIVGLSNERYAKKEFKGHNLKR